MSPELPGDGVPTFRCPEVVNDMRRTSCTSLAKPYTLTRAISFIIKQDIARFGGRGDDLVISGHKLTWRRSRQIV